MNIRKKTSMYVLVVALLIVYSHTLSSFHPVTASASVANNQIYLPLVSASTQTIIPESTNILTGESNQYLVSISADSNQFVFRRATSELNRVAPGEIIVSGVHTAAPNGYLRKVLTKETVNGQVILTTSPASLEEAIEQASLSFTYEFSQADIAEANLLPGVSLAVAPQSTVEPDLQVINLQLDRALLGGQVETSGSLALNMSMDFNFAIKRFSLDSMRMVLTATETSTLNLTYLKEAAGADEQLIARYRLNPLTIFVGSFPIVVQPTIEVKLGVDGTVSASMTTGVSQVMTLSGGVEYVDGDLRPVKGHDNDFDFLPPTLSAQLDVYAYASAGLELNFYTATPLVPELEVELRVGPRLQADQSLCWLLEGKLEVNLEAELKFIKWELDDIGTTLVSLATPLSHSQKCTLLEISPRRLAVLSRAGLQDLSTIGSSDFKEEVIDLFDFEATTELTAFNTDVTASAGGITANTTANGTIQFDTTPGTFGIPSFTYGAVTFDTGWNYNPNAVSDSIVNGLAIGYFFVNITSTVDGVFTLYLTGSDQRSDARGTTEGYVLWGSVPQAPGPDRYEIPTNGSAVYTRAVRANSINIIHVNAAGIDFLEDSAGTVAKPSSGNASSIFEWTFTPAGAP